MRFFAFSKNNQHGLAVATGANEFRGLMANEAGYPGSLDDLIQGGKSLAAASDALAKGAVIDPAQVTALPPLTRAPKIICLGLNYADHAAEGGFTPPPYPTLFGRFNTSLIADGEAMIRPRVSDQLDYEGELVAVIGRTGRHIAKDKALDYVAGYSVFNDGSVRDYQLKTPQWTVGKNFDGTGAFGPCLVTPEELPAGATGLHIETRLNGQVVQSASTSDMIFGVAETISLLSEALTLQAGDVLVMGTPAGIGLMRKPQLFMKPGDVCEVEIEKVGLLRNPIADE